MGSYFFLAMASVSIVKSLQNGLYLHKVGFDYRLPLIYVGLAVLSGPVVMLYRKLSRRYSNLWLGSCTLVVFVLSMLLFALLVVRPGWWIYLLFYAWGSVFSVLLPTQGWVIAGDLFTTREAKRLFSILGTGGILGGAAGGYYTALGARQFGSQGLLIQVCLLLTGILGILLVTHRRHRFRITSRSQTRRRGSPEGKLETARKLFQSRYLLYLAGIVLMGGFLSTLIDLQYKWVLDERFPGSEEQITRFFGILLGTIFVASLLFQLFATSQVLRRFGVGFALLLLPCGLLLGAAGVLVAATFWSVVILKAIDGCLRSSVDRTSVELLFVPLPGEQTATVKSFVNMVVFRFGDALGAALFLAFSPLFGPLKSGGILVVLAAALTLYLAWHLGEEYVRTLRKTLEIRPTPAARRILQFPEAVAQKTFLAALQSPHPTKVYFALQQLIPTRQEAESAEEDVSNIGEEMVQAEMSGLYDYRSPKWLESITPLVGHQDVRVAAAAFHLMVRYHPVQYLRKLRQELSSPEIPKLLYLNYLDRYVKRPGEFLREPSVLRWCQEQAPEHQVILARLMGKAKNSAFLPILEAWMKEPPAERARAAMEALGHYQDPRLVDALVDHLRFNWSRRAARRALSSYGDSVVHQLSDLLRDYNVDVSIKREIPVIFTSMCTPSSRAGLVAGLYLPDAVVSFRALKGLNKIRDFRDLSYGAQSFLPILQLWAKEYYELVNVALLLGEGNGSAWRLLHKAVKERKNWTLEKIFRGLALFFPRGDAYFSYLGYTSDQKELRENAIELIDSRIKGELRYTLFPIFEEYTEAEVARKGRQLFKLSSDLNEILADALFESDPWMKCCIIAGAASRPLQGLKHCIQQACEDVDPQVREAAQWALVNWGKAPC